MEITFNYEGQNLISQCQDIKEKIQDIFHNIKNEVDLNSLIFLYNGNSIEGNLSVSKIINSNDSQRNKMTILVIGKKEENANSCLIHSKDIICPKCGEAAKIDLVEYKILIQCKNKHNIGNIFLNEYEKT